MPLHASTRPCTEATDFSNIAFSSPENETSTTRSTPPAPPHPPHLGLEHIGLAVTNIDAVCAELKARGAEFTVEPHSPRPGLRMAFVRAPENVRIEVLERSTGT